MPFIAPLNEEGEFLEGFGWLSGMHVSEVTTPIFEDLHRKGLLYSMKRLTPTATRSAGAATPSWSSAWWTSGSSAWGKATTNRVRS